MFAALLPNLLTALAYASTGWLSLQLAVPPGYAVPIFIPAGIALAAMMTYGMRLWPGVFIGSLAVQVMAGFQAHLHGTAWLAIAIIAAGATLQSLTGVWLARCLIGLPSPLDRQDSIVRFFCVVAPGSCLIASTIAVASLVSLGGVSPTDALFNWWNWWGGDTIGVLVAAPLLLVFLGQPEADWRPRRTAVAAPLLVACALAVVAYFQVENWDEARIEARFTQEAEYQASLVRTRLDSQMDMLLAVERWLDTTPDPDANGFRNYLQPWLNRYPGVQRFGWAPRVERSRRDAFEQALRRRSQGDFQIQDSDARGAPVPAAEAADYLPLTFVEPLDNNWHALGLNLLTQPGGGEAVRRAWQSGQAEAGVPVPAAMDKSEQLNVTVYQAIYDNEPSQDGARPGLRGILAGVFRVGDVLNAILDGHQIKGLELCLVDNQAPAGRQRLYGPRACEADDWLQTPLKRVSQINFAGRPWQLRQRAGLDYIAPLRSWAAWTTIAVGLCSVGLLGAFLLVTSGSSRRVNHLVEQRTAQLGKAALLLEEQQAALEDAQRIARLGSWEWEPDETLMRCSAQMHQLLSGALPKLILRDFPKLFVDGDQEAVEQALQAALKAPENRTLDAHPRHPAPGVEVLHLQIESTWEDGRLVRLRGTLQDVTALRTAEAHIHYLAHYDLLTGLPNRNHWLSRARAALASAQRHGDRLAVLFLDLDRFKNVNDSLGHPVGDRLLATVAQRLSACLDNENLLARIGGDEFVVLLERIEAREDAAAMARKLLAALGSPIQVEDNELTPTVSIGVALFPDDGQDMDSLLQQADVAMYSAKAQGRNNYQFFLPDMTARASEKLSLEASLRRALERDEFVLHYQPQIEPHTGRVSGAEALIRWQHPERGLLMPGSFITVAEETGMIVPIGEWVLRETFRQQRRWQQEGLPLLRVAANISALQFLKPDFVTIVEQALAASGADPRQLELELTESTLMEPDEALIKRLSDLRQMGFTLALDDFGTGYSSLSYLKRLPISRLKVDRSFVRDLPGDPEDTAIAVATLSMARDLGLEVVAEGVETLDQMEFLLEKGCANMQGYYFARPLPVAEFEQYLRAHGGLDTWTGLHTLHPLPDL